jgi:hypothetical protein
MVQGRKLNQGRGVGTQVGLSEGIFTHRSDQRLYQWHELLSVASGTLVWALHAALTSAINTSAKRRIRWAGLTADMRPPPW